MTRRAPTKRSPLRFGCLRGAVCSALATTLAAGAAFGDAPGRNDVFIRGITAKGTGCPAGSVSASVSEDGAAFTVIYSQHLVELGPGGSPRARQSQCQVDVDLNVPRGWSVALARVGFRGYARLDARVRGVHRSSYHLPGISPRSAVAQRALVGPFDDDYGAGAVVPFDEPQWSRCGVKKDLRIVSQLHLDGTRNAAGGGLMTVDSADGELAERYELTWRRCP